MLWVRYEHGGTVGFGCLDGDEITVHTGTMFEAPAPSGDVIAVSDVKLLIPCLPGKMPGMWNNFHALAEKLGNTAPEEPLYFLKSPSSFIPHGDVIVRPASYDGPVVFEAELGIVIGKMASGVSADHAATHIFGYTCVNDVTAAAILNKDPTFPQWARAKGFDTFGPFGPCIATDIDLAGVSIRAVLNGTERQNYPASDMIFSPEQLVSHLSHDMTLHPGDVIACGTSVGVGSMKETVNTIEISIDGIGTLSNTFRQ